MTGMLASVKNLAEARLAAAAEVDIVDLKAPEHGSLGALPADEVARIVAALGGTVAVSATIGDLALDPDPICRAVLEMAATGVDYVKIGMFRGGDWGSTLVTLAHLARRGTRLVAVLFADDPPDFEWIARLKTSGFAGIMLDTQDKSCGSLTEMLDRPTLERFVSEAQEQGLMCGLAGSLRIGAIPALLSLQPDYLGFRGALCRMARRTAEIDPAALAAVRRQIPASSVPHHRLLSRREKGNRSLSLWERDSR